MNVDSPTVSQRSNVPHSTHNRSFHPRDPVADSLMNTLEEQAAPFSYDESTPPSTTPPHGL